jgi:Ca2+-binding RTX toxin-like protein
LHDNGNGTATLTGTVPAGVNGVSYFRVTAANGAQSDANQIFTLTIDQAPVFTSSQTTAFSAGAMGMFVITTAGYPAVTSITQTGTLPTGVTFTDNHDGTATLTSPAGSGTPGSFMLNLTATNGIAPDATQTLNLNVNQSGSIASAPAATFTVGSTGTFTITTNSFTVTPHIMQTSPMPAGVTFHDNGDGTATLSGDPTAGSGGIFRLNFVASNGSSLATQSFQLTVLEAPTFTSASSATIAIGVPATLPIMTRGFPAASLSITTGMLGGGITFQNNNNGSATLLGTPPMDGVGSYTVTITASNGVTPDATEQFTLTIAAPMVQKTQGGILMGIGSGGDDSGNLAINNGNIVFTIDGQQMSFPMGQINGIQLQFGQGDDSLAIGAGIPPVNLTGGTGNITIMSANAGDTVIAGNGNDLLDAGTGTDGMFRGGAGQDTISGGGANTTLVGGSGNAMLVPASKHEFIKGGAGSDTVVSSAGHDSIQGGAKSNIFLNGAGKKDTINGGSGLNFAEANSSDVMTNILQVIDPAPPTTPAVEAAAPALSPAAGTVVTATDTGGVVDVEGTAVADHIVVSTDGTNLIIKNHGALVQSFVLTGLTGILVNGKGGGDTITVASNVTLTETLFGGAGPDSIIGGGGSALLGGGAGSDTLVGGSSTSLLVPGQFETFTAALNGKDVLIGGSGFAIADLAYRTDPMFLSNDGKNDSGDPNLGEKLTIMPSVLAIWGGAGNDTVVGTVAGEFLSGGSGNATIQGGGTDDLLVGGLGTDTVRVAAEPVTLYLDNGNANRYTGVDNPDEDVLQLDSEDVSF